MTDIPTPALSEELDAVIELMQAKVSGAIFNGIKAFEHEPRRVLAVLLAARQQLAEMREVLGNHAFASSDRHLSGYRLTVGFDTLDQVQAAHQAIVNAGKAIAARRRDPNTSYETLEAQIGRDCAALAPTSQPSRGKCETRSGSGRLYESTVVPEDTEIPCPDCAQPERQEGGMTFREAMSVVSHQRPSPPQDDTQAPSELKPCPLCGGSAFGIPDDSYGDCHLGCHPCELRIHAEKHDYAAACERWNRRTPSPALREAAKAGAGACRILAAQLKPTNTSIGPDAGVDMYEVHAALLESLAEGV